MKERLCKILYGLEYVFDGLICEHWPLAPTDKVTGCIVCIRGKPRKWHPSYMLAAVRCLWLGDKCGSGMFKYGEMK